MSSSMLNVKPEEVETAEKRGKYAVSIIGCGQIGILHTCLFAEAGFKVKCVDSDQTIVNKIVRGKMPFLKREIELKLKNYVKMGLLSATTDAKTAVSQSDIIAITSPAKIDKKKKTDYSSMENACKQVGLNLHPGSLVIVMSTVSVGATEGLIKEVLENTSGLKVGADFGLAYSPIRILNGQALENLDHERVVAATDKNSLNAASTILGSIVKGEIKKTTDMKTAEVTALFEAIQRDANVALANEFALFCERVGVDYLEAHKLAKIGGSGSALSLPTLGDEKINEDPYLLLEDADNLNLKLRIPAIAREVNEEIVKHAVNLTKDALRNCGKTLRRARISLLGISKIPNEKSSPKRIVEELAEMLEARGAKVSLYDPYFSTEELAEIRCHPKKTMTEALEGADCIVLLTSHDQFRRLNLKRLKVMMKMPAAIIDFEGIVEPCNVEREGFIFRGLGRGVWSK